MHSSGSCNVSSGLCAGLGLLQWHAGDNVGTGKDYTLYSTIDGIVVYQKKAEKSKVGAVWASVCASCLNCGDSCAQGAQKRAGHAFMCLNVRLCLGVCLGENPCLPCIFSVQQHGCASCFCCFDSNDTCIMQCIYCVHS